MEGLIEALIEVFGEVILEILGSIIGNFVKVIDTDRKVKKAVKYIIAFIFFGASITLLTLSLIYKKSLLVILTVSYMLIMLILHLLIFPFFLKLLLEVVLLHLKKLFLNFLFYIFS